MLGRFVAMEEHPGWRSGEEWLRHYLETANDYMGATGAC
jgi:hypothetical protein